LSARAADGGRALSLSKGLNSMQFPRKTGWLAPALFLAAVAAVPAGAAEPDKFVPADCEAVAVFNFRQILESPLVKKYGLEELKTQIKSNKDAKKFFETSGIDPFKDIHSVTVAGTAPAKGGEPKYVVVVRGNFDPDKIHAAITEEAKTNGEDVKVETKDGLKVYELKNKNAKDKPMYAAFADKHTLILSPASEQTVAAAKGTGGKVAPDLAAALQKLGKESIYAAALVNDEMKKGLAGMNPQMKEVAPKVQYITATFDVTTDFKIVLAVQTKDDQAASKIKMFVSQMVPFLGMMAQGQEKLGPIINDLVKKIEVKKDDKNAVTVSLTITEELMKAMRDATSGVEKPKPQ
jgi:hypothetical protein